MADLDVRNLVPLVLTAGKIVKSFFDSGNFHRQVKADNSPLTDADIASNQFLVDELYRLFPFPVLSEEAHEALEQAHQAKAFWLLDPLDGTQAFLNQSPDFSINLALVDRSGPVIGIIHAPVSGEFWYGQRAQGAFYQKGEDPPTPLPALLPPECKVVKSRHHDEQEVRRWMNHNGFSECLPLSSAIKFGYVAMGKASIYLRYCNSSEWDTAAGHLIVKESGGGMRCLSHNTEPTYLKPQFKNGPFFAYSKGVACGGLKF